MSQKISESGCRSTNRQLVELVDYMSNHRDFALGRLTGPMGNQKQEAQWKELALYLCSFGPTKSALQWKNTWRDLRSKTRTKNAIISKQVKQTGNKGKIQVLNDMERKILSIIGTESSVGIGEPESALERTEQQEQPIVFAVETATSVENGESMIFEVSAPTDAPSPLTFEVPTEVMPTPKRAPKRTHTYSEMDDVAKSYANLQEKNNEIIKEVSETLMLIQRDLAKRNQLESERNDIERERNDIFQKFLEKWVNKE